MATFHVSPKALARALAADRVGRSDSHSGRRAQTPNPNATPSAAQQVRAAQHSRGFDVYNNTGHTLVLVGFRGASGIDRPRLGTHLLPGHSQHFELPFNWAHPTTGEAWYRAADGSSSDELGARFEVSQYFGISSVAIDIDDNTPASAKPWTYGNTVTFTTL